MTNREVIDEFRASGGTVGGFFADKDLLLLHHIGARSGRTRVTPLLRQSVGEGWAVFASAGGAPEHPGWYHDLVAEPNVAVEVGAETIPVTAKVLEGAERDEVWDRQVERHPFFGDYEDRSGRTIPVVLLEPR
ncbi:MAG: nitroreductase family deazaflavin-dependent oxidoreductase [Acidimicrobiia bacterium]|nr:nitroreductase family deazaflavin-dependent oxidoreductase [Acidimicrobiia bacterium]